MSVEQLTHVAAVAALTRSSLEGPGAVIRVGGRLAIMKVLAATCLLSSGCLVMTQTTTTARRIGTTQSGARPGKAEHVTIEAATHDGTLVVDTTAASMCSRDVLNVYEVRQARHLRMGGADDPRAQVFGMLLAPLTLPVSAVVSGIAVLGSQDDATERTNVDHTERFACTMTTPLAVSIELPSGSRVRTTTDARGKLTYAIPVAEPYDGELAVTAELDASASRTLSYHEPRPALVAAREAMAACGLTGVLEVETNALGVATRIGVAGGYPLANRVSRAACIAPHLAKARPFSQHHARLEIPFGPSPEPPIEEGATRIPRLCVAIDASRDALAASDRASARLALGHILETQDQLVVETDCDDTFEAWHELDDGELIVHVQSTLGRRRLRVHDVTALPDAYAQVTPALVELAKLARDRARLAHDQTTVAPGPAGDLQAKPDDRSGSAAGAAVELAPPGRRIAAETALESSSDRADGVTHPTIEIPSTSLYLHGGLGAIAGSSGLSGGAGVRHRAGMLAFDASANLGAGGTMKTGGLKAELLVVTAPASPETWYFGGGGSFGGTSNSIVSGYGVQAELTVGYEFLVARTHQRCFVQADLSVPSYDLGAMAGATSVEPTLLLSLGATLSAD